MWRNVAKSCQHNLKKPGTKRGAYTHPPDMSRLIQLFGVLGCTAILAGQTVEQTSEGPRGAAAIAAEFDGLGVGFEGPQGTATLRNPSDNSLAVGPESRRPDREFADGDLHQAGTALQGDGARAVRAGEHQQRVPRLRRHVRSTQQRRRRRSLRSTGEPLADRHADLLARGGTSGSATDVDGARRGIRKPCRTREPARTRGAALSTARTRTGTFGTGTQPGTSGTFGPPGTCSEGSVFDVLRAQRQ